MVLEEHPNEPVTRGDEKVRKKEDSRPTVSPTEPTVKGKRDFLEGV